MSDLSVSEFENRVIRGKECRREDEGLNLRADRAAHEFPADSH